MKIIALLPVRNEEWILRHSLACLSAFCDVIIVSDQASDDRSREIGAAFPKVQLIHSPASFIAEQARFRLWDVARQYDGHNVIWCTDADELIPPAAAARYFNAAREQLAPGTVIDCLYYHLWQSPHQYRASGFPYAPYWKPVAVVDDRQMDYDRSRALPIHQERVPIPLHAPRVRADDVPVLHLQWLLANTNQVKQAWYRCREWLEAAGTARAINARYQLTVPPKRVVTAAVPAAWLDGVTLPDLAIDHMRSWQEVEILRWFDERGVAFFEPLEIWHVPQLREAFVRHLGRAPRPDLSYRPSWPERTGALFLRFCDRVRRFGMPARGGTRQR
jgi:glycosyltransferase involved in cell wall biosynthesis